MNITYNEFTVLTTIEKEKTKLSQRKISELTNLSLGTINKIISESGNTVSVSTKRKVKLLASISQI